MTRADEVRRLAEALGAGPFSYMDWAQKAAEKLYDAGARMPEPPAPVNPISRETARAIIATYYGPELSFKAHDEKHVPDMQAALLEHAPSLVADLAEAAKDPNGHVVLTNVQGYRAYVRPAALVAALTGTATGGTA